MIGYVRVFVELTRSMMPVFPFLDGGAVASTDNVDNSVSTELCQCQCRCRVSVHTVVEAV